MSAAQTTFLVDMLLGYTCRTATETIHKIYDRITNTQVITYRYSTLGINTCQKIDIVHIPKFNRIVITNSQEPVLCCIKLNNSLRTFMKSLVGSLYQTLIFIPLNNV